MQTTIESANVKIAAIVIQSAVRILGVVLIVLGLLFWTHHAYNLVPLHMRLGETLAGLLLILAFLGVAARLSAVLTVSAILCGLIVVVFGMNMGGLLPGPAHELIRVLHFLLGLAAIALAESLGARIKRASDRDTV